MDYDFLNKSLLDGAKRVIGDFRAAVESSTPSVADLKRALLREGNMSSADDRRSALESIVARYRDLDIRQFLRQDAAFARRELYENLEAEGYLYAIRLPANEVLQRELQPLLTRPVGTLYTRKASPWENGYVKGFYGNLRDEQLNRELSLSLPEARHVLDERRLGYNHRPPHSRIGWQTPAAYAATWKDEPTAACSAASLDGSAVGAAPLPANQPANQQQIIPSQYFV